jgi:branched-chain amino acid transport system ATP-binding protein
VLLEVSHLDSHYGEVQVLFDVSFGVTEGAVVSIVGSNAAGKTTLIKAVSGMTPATAGKVAFMGRDITNLPPSAIVEMGIVQIPEGRKLFPGMTVEENLEMGAFTRTAARQMKGSMERAYAVFPTLAERRRQLAGTLSGGEQQMLAIARGLMSLPKLLMFDEPSLGLAPIIVERMFEVVRDINRDGTTVLMVEQNVFHALSLSSTAYVIENGRIVLQGTGAELLGNDKVREAYLGL